MGVFKEELAELEFLASKQRIRWPDACDFGIDATPDVKDTMRRVLRSLLELRDAQVVYKIDTPNLTQRSYDIPILFTPDEGVRCFIGYYKDRSQEFFSIEFHPIQA